MSHHITSHHITSHHIISYHIISYHDITWGSKMTFFKSSGDLFFDPKSLSIDLLVMVPECFEVTFDRFFPGPQNGPKRPEIYKKDQNKKIKKMSKNMFLRSAA